MECRQAESPATRRRRKDRERKKRAHDALSPLGLRDRLDKRRKQRASRIEAMPQDKRASHYWLPLLCWLTVVTAAVKRFRKENADREYFRRLDANTHMSKRIFYTLLLSSRSEHGPVD